MLRIWDVILFEGNRVMLFRTALALMELYGIEKIIHLCCIYILSCSETSMHCNCYHIWISGPEVLAAQDAGDAITSLQNLTSSTFDSSQLVLTACMGYVSVTEARLQELRTKHRPSILTVIEERTKGQIRKETKRLASKLYSFKPDRSKSSEDVRLRRSGEVTPADGYLSQTASPRVNCQEPCPGMTGNSAVGSVPDLQEQVVFFFFLLSFFPLLLFLVHESSTSRSNPDEYLFWS